MTGGALISGSSVIAATVLISIVSGADGSSALASAGSCRVSKFSRGLILSTTGPGGIAMSSIEQRAILVGLWCAGVAAEPVEIEEWVGVRGIGERARDIERPDLGVLRYANGCGQTKGSHDQDRAGQNRANDELNARQHDNIRTAAAPDCPAAISAFISESDAGCEEIQCGTPSRRVWRGCRTRKTSFVRAG